MAEGSASHIGIGALRVAVWIRLICAVAEGVMSSGEGGT